VIAHELAHQWFGDSVSLDRWQDIWLNEGFATYAEWLWVERSGGKTVKQQFDDHYLPANDPRWQVPPADPGSSSHLFDPFAVYVRGAMALQVLRNRVGDATFWTILRTWAAERRHGNATTADFVRTAGQVAHQDVGGLLGPWLNGRTRPPSE
jgi:aminopeptidase N